MTELFFSFGSENGTIFCKTLGLSTADERKHSPHRPQVIELSRELRLPLYGYLISVGMQPHEAEEVIQEIFLRLHQQLAPGIKINDPGPWAFRVAHNLSMNLHRSSRRFISEPESDNANEETVPLDSPDHRPTPEDFSFDMTGQANLGCTPGKRTLTCWFNQAAFAIPSLAPGQTFAHNFGNSYGGEIVGPSQLDFDLALMKKFAILEGQDLTFRAEAFNFANHAQFAIPNAIPDVPGGASVTSTLPDNQREIQFNLKYNF